jgi:predicted AAA+ superfamily ATPase
MEIETLTRQNPWWKGKELIDADDEYRKWKSYKIKWVPSILDKISIQPFSLNFIFGPRQVGKTTLLKLLIKKLLDNGIEPKRIFYFRCDKLANFKELDEVIKTYFEFRKENGIDSSFILLDEITFPEEWFRTIKFYMDVGEFKKDVLILTGSLSMHLKKEVELFPGRRGKGKDYIMMPLSFREFIRVISPKTFEKLPTIESLEAKEIIKKSSKILPFVDELNDLFKKYLKCGGFPLAINSFFEEGLTNEVKDTYWSWIKTDLAKIGRDENTFKKVVKAVLEKTPSAISLNSIAKEFEIGTHKTAYEYTEIMSQLFISKILYFIEPTKIIANFKKNRKIHFTDPFFFYLFSDLCFTKIPEESIIVENVIAAHIARKYETFYWSNKSEIDIVAREKDKLFGFEVKWSEKVKQKKIILGKMKQLIILSKKEYDVANLIIPASVFLALLDV